jgi:flagellar hook-associated protein FlgK
VPPSITTAPAGAGTDITSTDLTPEIGITATPVFDPSTSSLYLTAKTRQIVANDTAHPHYVYTLYKVNTSSATYISQIIGNTTFTPSNGTYAYDQTAGLPYMLGTGQGNITVGGERRIYFNALRQLIRPGAVLYNGRVYIASASHGDAGPYHGWLLSYDASTLALKGAFNTTPTGGLGGIWEGGGITAIDAQGNFYFETGNGTFNTNSTNFNTQGFPIDGNYGDCFVKVALDPTSTGPNTNANINGWGMKVVDYFSPFNNASLNGSDADLGSGGPVILSDSLGSAAHPHLLVGAGKEGKIYLIDRDNMGKFDPATDHVVQEQGSALNGSQGTAALFMLNPGTSTPGSGSATLLYGQGYGGATRAFSVINGAFSSSPTSSTRTPSDISRVRPVSHPMARPTRSCGRSIAGRISFEPITRPILPTSSGPARRRR